MMMFLGDRQARKSRKYIFIFLSSSIVTSCLKNHDDSFWQLCSTNSSLKIEKQIKWRKLLAGIYVFYSLLPNCFICVMTISITSSTIAKSFEDKQFRTLSRAPAWCGLDVLDFYLCASQIFMHIICIFYFLYLHTL